MEIVDIVAALIMGALSGMGIGGGGLLVIYLTLVKGTGQIEAQGLNLYFFMFASVAALFIHCMKRKINYPLVLYLALCGIPGAYAGSYAASSADPHYVKMFFGLMLIIAGGLSLFRTAPMFFKKRKK